MITDLIDHLMDAGYEPDDSTTGQTMAADLIVSGIGSVRCIRTCGEAEVHAFDQYMNCRWSARFASAPDTIVIGALEAAEWELAALRGGPVTPAQAASAR
jgi:hypothetical protein